ncbi:hypothetical protein ABZW03_03710 [Kitasatospora sp. NPDC004799]|uniref:hypothetical protein n=1 Tax=Kitasatospora sp. NPDC004799 TaxID=3154460 RepID=UPI0033A56045
MKTRTRWGTAAAVVAVAAATVGGSSLASADASSGGAETAPPAVEDFSYPGPSPYPELKLLRGDGHILVADCHTTTQIKLYSRVIGGAGPSVCFRVTAPSGYLSLELPQTFIVQTTDYPVHARLTTSDGASTSVDVPSNSSTNVGEGLGQKPTAVVELRVG